MTKHRTRSASDLLDIKQTADYLRVCTKTIYQLIKTKQLHAQRVGTQWRIAAADVRGYLATTRS